MKIMLNGKRKSCPFGKTPKKIKLFQKFLGLATTNMVSWFSRDLVNWESKNSNYGNGVGQGSHT